MFLVNSLFLGHTSLAPGLLLALSTGSVLDLWELFGVLRIEPRWVTCKANTLSTVLPFCIMEKEDKYTCIIKVDLYEIANTLLCGET